MNDQTEHEDMPYACPTCQAVGERCEPWCWDPLSDAALEDDNKSFDVDEEEEP